MVHRTFENTFLQSYFFLNVHLGKSNRNNIILGGGVSF